MTTYTLHLTPQAAHAVLNMSTEGGLDTALTGSAGSQTSIQRTGYIQSINSGDVVGNALIADGGTFDNVVDVLTDLPFIS